LADIIVSGDEDSATTTTVATAVTPASTTSVQTDADNLPEKFRGKSPKEIVEMYQHLESEKGRLANELGTQRVLTDRILQIDQKRARDLGTNTPPEQKPAPVTTDDILNRPQEALERVTDARTRAAVEPVNGRIAQLEAQLAQTRFEARHPDFTNVVNDPKFASWVQESPLRTRAAVAANAGNWDVASELLSDFKRENAASAARTSTTTSSSSTTENPQLGAARRERLRAVAALEPVTTVVDRSPENASSAET